MVTVTIKALKGPEIWEDVQLPTMPRKGEIIKHIAVKEEYDSRWKVRDVRYRFTSHNHSGGDALVTVERSSDKPPSIFLGRHTDDLNLCFYIPQSLDRAPDLNADNINVAVSDGVVTLTGKVPTYPQRQAAERAALGVPGVKNIVNSLDVCLPEDRTRPDEDIARAVQQLIEWHTQLPADTISVTVDEGQVSLQGTVTDSFQAQKAEQAVSNLKGVRGLKNQLTVDDDRTVRDLRERILSVLERQSEVDPDQVSVSVDDGTAILEGTVQSWPARHDLEQAARADPSLSGVINKLQVLPESPAH